MKLAAYVPLYPPFSDEAFMFPRFRSIRRELVDLTGKVLCYRDLPFRRGSNALSFSIITLQKSPDIVRTVLSGNPRIHHEVEILKVALDLTLTDPLPGNEKIRDRAPLAFAHEIENIIYRIVLAANIAKPGCLYVDEGMIVHRGRWLTSTSALLSDLEYAEAYVRKLGWPNIRELPLERVLTWYGYDSLYHRQPPPTGRLARAINAVSYLLRGPAEESEVSSMVYSLIGLEALYSDSHEGVADQIDKKAQVFLGEMSTFKKALKQMYNIRSRFVHGEFDFPPSFHPFAESEYPENYEEVRKSSELASMVLISTLQNMCEQSTKALRFRWTRVEDG